MSRSEDIDLYKISMYKDEGWNVMNELGKLNQLHFVDLNKNMQPFDLPFTSGIKNAEESLRKIK